MPASLLWRCWAGNAGSPRSSSTQDHDKGCYVPPSFSVDTPDKAVPTLCGHWAGEIVQADETGQFLPEILNNQICCGHFLKEGHLSKSLFWDLKMLPRVYIISSNAMGNHLRLCCYYTKFLLSSVTNFTHWHKANYDLIWNSCMLGSSSPQTLRNLIRQASHMLDSWGYLLLRVVISRVGYCKELVPSNHWDTLVLAGGLGNLV